MTNSAYVPTEELLSLRQGDISQDRVAAVGGDHRLFLFQGSNDHFRSYAKIMEHPSRERGRAWANLTAQRQAKSSTAMQVLSLFVPNPASCMPDLYPLPLPVCPTPAFQEMRGLLKDDDGVLFCDELFEASTPDFRDEVNPWLPTDSHWSEFGALLVTNSLLRRLGVSPVDTHKIPIKTQFYSGDLGARFGERVGAFETQSLEFDLPNPECVYDSGSGSLDGAHMGRRVEWRCPGAPIASSILVVGNSFSGSGLVRLHLSYWLSRVFQRTVFLHGSSIPTDCGDRYRPDILLFQGLERFLEIVPVDAYTAEECERMYSPSQINRR